ncbi:MAG: hypothetical protein HOD92_16185 [Deltaproteobacteria bacterium]|nr:hypothetical protein [Deltaproteobacteria bacterium]
MGIFFTLFFPLFGVFHIFAQTNQVPEISVSTYQHEIEEDTQFSVIIKKISDEIQQYSFRKSIAKNSINIELRTILLPNVINQPKNGVIQVETSGIIYKPNLDFSGFDRFAFSIKKQDNSKETFDIFLTINPINDPPKVQNLNIKTFNDTETSIVLEATDVDSKILEYIIKTQPVSGLLVGTPPNITYTPNSGFTGKDLIIYQVNDGKQTSKSAIITIEVEATEELITEYEIDDFQLIEEFILFQTGKESGESFYRVMVDFEERPYLDVQAVLGKWLNLFPDCKPDILSCQANHYLRNKNYWIDGLKKEYGDQLERSTPKKLPENALVKHEGNLWLRYDIWSQWIPVTTNWSVNEYHLTFFPQFTLLNELIEARQKHRKLMVIKHEKQQKKDNKKPLMPEGSFRPELKYQIMEERYTEDGVVNNTVKSALNVDLWQGTLKVGGSFSQYNTEKQTTESTDSYWNYKRKHQPLFEVLEFGDMRLDRTILMPAMVAKNGIRLDHIENNVGVEILNQQGVAPSGTEIDLYYNGFLINTTFVGEDGLYTIDNYSVPGGEYARLVFYYPNGSQKEEIIKIASDNGWILNDGEWNTRLFTGEKDWGQVSRLDISHGFTERGTLGLQTYTITKDQSIEEEQLSLSGAYFAWRPFYGLYLMFESLESEFGTDYAVQSDISYFFPLNLKLEAHKLTEESPLLSLFQDNKQTTEFKQISYNIGIARWLWQVTITDTLEKQEYFSNITHHFNPNFFMFIENEHSQIKEANHLQQHRLGAELNYNQHNIQLARTSGKVQNSWSLGYRLKSQEKQSWYITFNLMKPDEDEINFQASLTWCPIPQIKAGLRKQTDNSAVWASWSDIIAVDPGPETWDEFGTGTLSGIILSPVADGEEPFPMEGVLVKAGSKKGITDQDGFYKITGLPTDQRVEVQIDLGTLDIGMMPKQEEEIIYFRPGTYITYNPELMANIGLDGYLNLKKEIPAEASFDVIRASDQTVLMTVFIESDGFFIIEGLVPGNYLLKLKGVFEIPKNYPLELKDGDVWLSGVTLE